MTYQVKFIGDPKHPLEDRQSVEFGGMHFERDKAVTVPDEIGEKLKRNSHFEVTGEASGKAVKVADQNLTPQDDVVQTAAAPVPSLATSTSDKPAEEPHMEHTDGDDQGPGDAGTPGNRGGRRGRHA